MRTRGASDSEAELEALLAQVDRAIDQGTRRAAQSTRGEAEIVNMAQQLYDLWGQLPDDVQDQIKQQVRQLWDVRGALWLTVVRWVGFLVARRGISIQAAVQQAGRQFNLRPRQPRGRSPQDVRTRQFHRRQLQRGRVPGRNPQMRRRMQREQEVIAFPSGRRPSGRPVPTNPWPRLLRLAERFIDSAGRQLMAGNSVRYARDLRNAATYVGQAAAGLRSRIDLSPRRAQVMAELLTAQHALQSAQALFAQSSRALTELDRARQAITNARRAVGLRTV